MRRQTLSFDFDGVIHAYSKGWHNGECYDPPMPGAFDFIREALKKYCVFVLTTRDVYAVTAYFNEHAPDIQVQGNTFPSSIFWNKEGVVLVTNRKLAAVAYIDDRAIRFDGDWEETQRALDTLR